MTAIHPSGQNFRQRYRCGLRKLPYHVCVNTSTTRGHRSWQTGEVFTTADATDLYEVDRWGKGYFSISPAGHVLVHPTKDPARAIDLKQLTDHLMLRGIQLPVLIRFRDILRHRVGDIAHAFQAAIAQHQYEGRYAASTRSRSISSARWSRRCRDFGREYGFGLEAGSKPELLAVAALGAQRHAHHLQRLQGRRVHRDGDAGPEDRAERHPRRREVHRARA